TLVHQLQKSEESDLNQHGDETQKYLVKQVEDLNEESFLVRQHWRVVEKYKDPHCWNSLNELDVKELFDHIGPLVNEYGEDELAKRFDLVCYNMQSEILSKGTVSDYHIGNVKEIAAKLSKKGSIPAVAEKMDLIKLLQT